MPKSRGRRSRKPSANRQRGPSRRLDRLDVLKGPDVRQRGDSLAVMGALVRATDAAEARGDAAGALRLMMEHPVGPDGHPFWAPWRVLMLMEIIDHGSDLPAWAVSRWLVAQSVRHLQGNRDRVRAACRVAVELRGGEGRLPGVDRRDAVCRVMDHDWVFRQLLAYELGGLRHFLDRAAAPDMVARADKIRDWSSARLHGYRLLGRSGAVVLWQDLATDEAVPLLDLGADVGRRPGECVLGRVVPIGGGQMFETAPLTVPPEVAAGVAADPAAWLDVLRAGGTKYGVSPRLGPTSPDAIVVAGRHEYALLSDLDLGVRPGSSTPGWFDGPQDAA